ncbi:MAG: signal peptidase I [Cyanobacteria bacterium NC_groundwater_1444_Ag_S-0.65um_54_12]|nr:signal peptidase I [Cyanobacteria bacterium NC_groundwater_1444_Ag_S-0.65um_54_12]
MDGGFDLAFGLIVVAALSFTFLLNFFVVVSGTLYVWNDTAARGKSLAQRLVWSGSTALMAPLGLFLYLLVHRNGSKTGIEPPLFTLKGIVTISLLFLLLLFGINPYVALPITNVGDSMEPTLHSGDRLIADRLASKFNAIRRGDILLLLDNEGDLVIKRVIALSGDAIEVHDGLTWIDGVPIREWYLMAPPSYQLSRRLVPADTYFVLGDNRNVSLDSHYLGPVRQSRVIGKIRFRFWPIGNIASFG